MRHIVIRKLMISAILGVISSLILARNLFLPISVFDEGFILVGASRVLDGAIPHKDFFSTYPPGQYYILSGLFSLLGKTVAVERFWDLGVRCGIAVAGFWLVRSIASIRLALVSFIALTTWLWFLCMPGFPGYPFLLCAFICVGTLIRSQLAGSSWLTSLAGLFAGAAMLFRHDMGLMLILGMTVVLILFPLHAMHHQYSIQKGQWRNLWSFLALAIFILLVGFGRIISAGGGRDLCQQLLEWPRTYIAYTRLPYPSPIKLFDFSNVHSLKSLGHHLVYDGLPVVLPSVLILSTLFAGWQIRHKSELQISDRMLILLLVVALSTLHYAVVRSDMEHFGPLALVLIPLSFVWLVGLGRCFPRISIGLGWLVASFWCLPLGVYAFRLSGPIPTIPTNLSNTVEYLNKHHSGDAIYVGVENHDRFVFSSVVLYFLTECRCPTRHHWLQTGVVTTLAVQQEIIAELTSNRVQAVVLTPGMMREPNESNRDQGVNLLDHYLADHYQTATNFGEYRIMDRRLFPLPDINPSSTEAR